jgi:penicillin-binding protein 1A
VEAKGKLVTPYGIRKVTTTDGEVLYSHRPDPQQQLVPDYVAAEITDLLQTAVNIGTGRAAQIGRPVAGKTGTTSSNKDGWFLGFSSGVTTGVWMGRDDAHPVPGLQGGTAPARAFAAYMRVATAKRPVEQFDNQLKLPEWQLEPDDEALLNNPNDYYYTDENGNTVNGQQGDGLEGGPAAAGGATGPHARRCHPRRPGWPGTGPAAPARQAPRNAPPAASDDLLDRATGRTRQQAPRPAAWRQAASQAAGRSPGAGLAGLLTNPRQEMQPGREPFAPRFVSGSRPAALGLLLMELETWAYSNGRPLRLPDM